MSIWTDELTEQLIGDLKGETDQEVIAAVCRATMTAIAEHYQNFASRKKPLAAVRNAVKQHYPTTDQKTAEYQHATISGRRQKDDQGRYIKNSERWEHLALKYLTLSQEEWDHWDTQARQEFRAKPQQAAQPDTANTLTLSDMNLEQLELDIETRQTVEQAIAQTGMELADFVRRALQVYAKTVTGKTRKHGEELTTVPTEKLLNDPAYGTHPGRGEELTKRAIRAIMSHNNEVATEQDQRWCVTQTAITEITGSRAATVKAALEPYQQMIDEHNSSHSLNPYSNRKGKDRDITQEVDLVKLVPSGLD